jgi:two-component system, OmpR family, response regulator
MRVLVIEDNEVVVELVQAGFSASGWIVTTAKTGFEALDLLDTTEFDAVVLDIELPDMDGFAVLAEIRKRPGYLPVVMLTARGGPDATVVGLVAGADDYVSKPFDMHELSARVLAVVRRVGTHSQEVLQLGNFTFNRLTRETMCAGRRLRLTPKEQSFLEQLLAKPGAAVSRDELLRKVWRINFDPGSNLMDAHVARLRAKLATAGCSFQISTRRNEGFAAEIVTSQSATVVL